MFARPTAAVVLAGLLFSVGSTPAHPVEPRPVVREQAADHTPTLQPDPSNARPKTYALARNGATMFAGGAFHHVVDRHAVVHDRQNLMAFDEATGELASLDVRVKGTVFALATSGSALYVGGVFSAVNGVPRRGLAKINLTRTPAGDVTGVLDPTFAPTLGTGKVAELALVNGRLLVGGLFSRGLTALDLAKGRDTGYLNVPFKGSVSPSASVPTGVYSFSVNPRGTRLVAVGNFTTVAGQSRKRAVVLRLHSADAVVDPWYYKPLARRCKSKNVKKYAYLTDVDFAPGGNWFTLVSTGWVPRYPGQIGTSVCDAAARFELRIKQPIAPTWINYTGGDTLYSVESTGSAVYVQGHNRWLDNPYGVDSAGPGAVVRRGLGAIDSVTGAALGWNPDKPATQGGQAFLSTPVGLWVGSDSAKVGGEPRRGLALFPHP